MKFTAKEDIEAPLETVFDAVSDFDAAERAAVHRGATVTRTDHLAKPGPGLTWQATVPVRGRSRDIQVELVEYAPPDGLLFAGSSANLEATCRLDLTALTRRRTRLEVVFDLKPRNLSGRLMIQSIKLARPGLTQRLRLRLSDFAARLESRVRNPEP